MLKFVKKNWLFIVIVTVLFVIAFNFTFTSKTITIQYASALMQPTLHTGPQRVHLLDPKDKSQLPRGTIVYYELLETDESGREPGNYISRIVGLPGEKVSMTDSVIFINGSPLDEPYVGEIGVRNQELSEKDIPRDSYFLIGDLRPGPTFFVKSDNIIGIVKNR